MLPEVPPSAAFVIITVIGLLFDIIQYLVTLL